MLKNEELNLETTTKNMKKRSYRIKNFLEELLTLEIINKRNVNENNNRCMRCKMDNESWNHVWECDMNSFTLYDIVNGNILKNIENLKKKNIYVNKDWWMDRIIKILLDKSTIKANQLIIHECIKGIFNKRLTEMKQNKDIKVEMEKLIEGIAIGTKEKIWNEWCGKINKIEKYIDNKKEINHNKNVTKSKLKKTKEEITNHIELEEKLTRLAKNNLARNNKKLMSKVIADRYIDHLITQQENVNKIWTTTYIYMISLENI
ncbi:hypothetical protein C1645_820838 [Glomus cerebriforme]|uniref:Uncharacterized protein n=1 Tax=Glomus cerebriforme TaxID=658196 RepID=A0A397T7U7_9GLOM|nr:hypothetical protein C1645_820838 [Glomus cerebriforme]